MTRKNAKTLVFLLFSMFSIMVIGGSVLLFANKAKETQPSTHDSAQTEVKFEAHRDKTTVDIKSHSEAIIVISLGTSGLLLLAVRVPIQWVSYRRRHSEQKGNMMTFSLGYASAEPVYSDVERMPILVWWLLKNRAPIVRATQEE